MGTSIDRFNDFFGGYTAIPATYDELRTTDGRLAPPYEKLITSLERIGRDEFSRRWAQAEQALRENGIAYSGYSGKKSRPRTWQLDAIPLAIEQSEWSQIQRAIQQRAALLNLVTKDLYGPRTLLTKGIIPPDLIFADPGYHHHNIGVLPTGDAWVHLYAADIARSWDGRWWIMTDRTEAPSGLGYALEHRVVLSRLLSESYFECQVKRLAPFFRTLRNTVKKLAHRDHENPLTILLSDGTVNPYHLEDAYLARYLGYMLVEDGDLTVRSSQTMLKTLGGLKQVDVILRHQNSSESDPLMYPSAQGIAGLSQSAKVNQVAVTNPIGSGLTESAAYMAFTARFAQELLGEELLLPNVATWWCGEPGSLDYVLANIDTLIIQPAYRRRGSDTPRRKELLEMSRHDLVNAIRQNPTQFVGQERVRRSSAPTWGDSTNSEFTAMRCYSVADFQSKDPESELTSENYEVMDGGLGRMTKSDDPLQLTISDGETSKDVWVLSDSPVAFVTLLDGNFGPIEIRRSGADLPSRVADDLFWLGRLLERAESRARLLSVTLGRMVGELQTEEDDLAMLIRCLAQDGLIESGYAIPNLRTSLPNIRFALPNFIFDDWQSDSMRRELQQLKRLASQLRDRLSIQAWRTIQSLDRDFKMHDPRQSTAADLLDATNKLLVQLAAISGMVMENMTRTQVYQFLDLGRRIERSNQTLSMLANGALFSEKPSRPTLEATLELGDSLMTYRSRYLANMHRVGVLDLLITDETNPRSLTYQFVRIQDHVEQLPVQDGDAADLRDEQRLIIELVTAAKTFDVNAVEGTIAARNELQSWSNRTSTLARLLSHRYLVHASAAHQLTDIGRGDEAQSRRPNN